MNLPSNFEHFVPATHAPNSYSTWNSHFRGNFADGLVVTGGIPLKDITFGAEHDILHSNRVVGDPADCPKLDSLEAVPSVPPISGAEALQHLTVPCPLRRTVIGPNPESDIRVVAYPVCVAKIGEQGLDINALTDEQVSSPDGIRSIGCPFSYLGGIAAPASGEGIVHVAVDSKGPSQERIESQPLPPQA